MIPRQLLARPLAGQATAPAQPLAPAHAGADAQPEGPGAPAHRITAYVPLMDRASVYRRTVGAAIGGVVLTEAAGHSIVSHLEGNWGKDTGSFNHWVVSATASVVAALPFAAVKWLDHRAIRAEQRVGLWTLQPTEQLDRIVERAVAASPLTFDGLRACVGKLVKVIDAYPRLEPTELSARLASLAATVELPTVPERAEDEDGPFARLAELAEPLIRLCQAGRITPAAMDNCLLELARRIGGETQVIPVAAARVRHVLDVALQATLPATQPVANATRRAVFHTRLDQVREFRRAAAAPAAPAAPAVQEASDSEEDHDAIALHMPAGR